METFIGHIKTPQDALIIFEACRRGMLHRVKRRLSTQERMTNIQSGSIFAFDEGEAGMRRWTDGRTWSPSRVLGSFLTYRELDTKRRPRRHSAHSASSSFSHGGGMACSYKSNGLIKQSFSICTASNQKLHLVSYYSKADVIQGHLTLPSQDPNLSKIVIPKGLYPELNPLDTSGGHSATLHLMMKASIDEQQQQQQQNQQLYSNGNSSNSSIISNNTNDSDSYQNIGQTKFVYGQQPPSLSSSPLSTCSDDDLLSPSHVALSFSPQRHPSNTTTTTTNSTSTTAPPPPPSPSPIISGCTPPISTILPLTTYLSPPAQVWKPYSLQAEDTRQLEALKTQLRI